MRVVLVTALAFAAAPAGAAVKQAGPAGFQLEDKVVVPVSPDRAFAALGLLPAWWDPSHTYSGSGSNLTMGLKAGDCFCERTPKNGGSIEHARVVYSQPGATLRLHGALGPLQSQAVNGTLTYSLKQVPEGTEVTQTYVVGGYFTMSAGQLAPLVDKVMNTQLMRYRDHLTPKR